MQPRYLPYSCCMSPTDFHQEVCRFLPVFRGHIEVRMTCSFLHTAWLISPRLPAEGYGNPVRPHSLIRQAANEIQKDYTLSHTGRQRYVAPIFSHWR